MRALLIILALALAIPAQAQLSASRTGPSGQTSFFVTGQLGTLNPPLLVTTNLGGVTNIQAILSLPSKPSLAAAPIGIAPAVGLMALAGDSIALANIVLDGNNNIIQDLPNAKSSLSASSTLGFPVAGNLKLKSAAQLSITGIGTSKTITAGISQTQLTQPNSLTASVILNIGSVNFTSRMGIADSASKVYSMYGLIQPGVVP
jgi:hypothetical protein